MAHPKYGWIPDLPDNRDAPYVSYASLRGVLKAGPDVIDLRETGLLPKVLDQGDLGSCGLNAGAAMAYYVEGKEGNKDLMFSRLAWYYDIRMEYGQENEDTGIQMRDLFRSLKRTGCALEINWEYDLKNWNVYPDMSALHEGYHRRLNLSYYRMFGTFDIESCIAEGYPAVFGAVTYESFDSVGPSGLVPIPEFTEQRLGGHAMLIVGYLRKKKLFIVLNSWGTSWGDQGYCYIPYAYMQQYAWDFWTLRKVAR